MRLGKEYNHRLFFHIYQLNRISNIETFLVVLPLLMDLLMTISSRFKKILGRSSQQSSFMTDTSAVR